MAPVNESDQDIARTLTRGDEMTPEEEARDLAEFEAEAREGINEAVARLKQKNPDITLLWEPGWHFALDFIDYYFGIYEKGNKALASAIENKIAGKYRFKVRFADGDDELHVCFSREVEYYVTLDKYGASHKPIEITLHTQGSRFKYEVERECGEMTAYYIDAGNREHLPRVVEILDKITDDISIIGMLASTGKCHQCNRKLTDPVSKVIQYGPTCAKNIGIPHTSETAKAVLAWRKEVAA